MSPPLGTDRQIYRKKSCERACEEGDIRSQTRGEEVRKMEVERRNGGPSSPHVKFSIESYGDRFPQGGVKPTLGVSRDRIVGPTVAS